MRCTLIVRLLDGCVYRIERYEQKQRIIVTLTVLDSADGRTLDELGGMSFLTQGDTVFLPRFIWWAFQEVLAETYQVLIGICHHRSWFTSLTCLLVSRAAPRASPSLGTEEVMACRSRWQPS